MLPILGPNDDQRLGYRSRVKLCAHWLADRWTFGLESRDEFTAIESCPVHAPQVNAALAILSRALPAHPGFPLRYFVQSGRLITLVLKSSTLPSPAWLTTETTTQLQDIGIRGLHLNLHPAAGRILFSKRWHCIWGETRVRDALGLWHGPAGFQQLIPGLYAGSLDAAASFLAPRRNDAVIDLYSGVGASLRHWLDAGANAIGVECDGEALACAALNAPGAVTLRGLCSQRLPQLQHWLASTPDARRLAYVNPPRIGLEPAVAGWLCREARPERIAYLSCSPGTLRRDLEFFVSQGWRVVSLQPFDFFPQTHHVETLACLERVTHFTPGCA